MGVDASISVRLFQDDSEDYKEVEVSAQDNSLASLFQTDYIRYTSIEFDRRQELSPEENAFIDLTDQDEDGMVSQTDIVDAKELFKIFDTIDRKLQKLKKESLNIDLNKIQLQLLEAEEKEKRKKYQISQYLHFESSYSLFMGILKTAALLNFKVQIVVNSY